MNHASTRVSAFKRFHVVTWFGVCGNRKYRSAKAVSEDECPVCGEDMVRCVCVSKKRFVKDIGDPDYKPWFVDDELNEKGEENYPDVVGGRDYVDSENLLC